MKSILFLLLLSITANSFAEIVDHIHGHKQHIHALPISGLNHKHGALPYAKKVIPVFAAGTEKRVFAAGAVFDDPQCQRGDCVNGQGTYVFKDGRKYVGQFENRSFHGFGIFTWPNGERYVGQFNYDLRHGQGTMTKADGRKDSGLWENGSYTKEKKVPIVKNKKTKPKTKGCISGNCYNGQGVHIYENGLKYVGQFKNGRFHGQGISTAPDGTKYSGQFHTGKMQGIGTVKFASIKKEYTGQFKNNTPNGQGTLVLPNGDKYTGNFKDGSYDGQGVLAYSDGGKYVGSFKGGKKHGQGTVTLPDGRSGTLLWKNGKAITDSGRKKGQNTTSQPTPSRTSNRALAEALKYGDLDSTQKSVLRAGAMSVLKACAYYSSDAIKKFKYSHSAPSSNYDYLYFDFSGYNPDAWGSVNGMVNLTLRFKRFHNGTYERGVQAGKHYWDGRCT